MTRTGAAGGRLTLVVLVILGGLTAVGPLSLDTYLPALPALGEELGASQAEVQLSLTACLLGIALGQLVWGPFSDAFGRRRPLVVGAAAYAFASLACAFAPDLVILLLLRFVQGFAGAMGVVVARAVVRDLVTGHVAVRHYSQLATAGALAPVVAPVLGAAILLFSTWRGVFVALAVIGGILVVALAAFVPESHPRAHRASPSPRVTARGFAELLRDGLFLGYLGVGALGATTLFAYLAGSSYVLQQEFGADAGTFAFAFALNGFGIGVLSHINARVAPRVGAGRMLTIAFIIQSTAALALLVLALLAPRDPVAIPVVMAIFFALVAPLGFVMPNYIARGMSRSRANAGTASALLGAATFLVGAIVSPLTGLGDPTASVAAVAVAGAVGGLVLVQVVTRRDEGGSAQNTQPEGAGA